MEIRSLTLTEEQLEKWRKIQAKEEKYNEKAKKWVAGLIYKLSYEVNEYEYLTIDHIIDLIFTKFKISINKQMFDLGLEEYGGRYYREECIAFFD
jgi:hypothetical protein